MCAFDLLATVAGKLLLAAESSRSSTDTWIENDQCAFGKDSVMKEKRDVDKSSEVKLCEQETCDMSLFVSKLVSQAPVNYTLKEFPHELNDACSGLASVITTSDCSEKAGSAEKLVNGESKIEYGSFASKVDVDIVGCRGSSTCKLENGSREPIKIDQQNTGKASVSTRTGMFSSEDQVVCDRKPPALLCSHNSVKVSCLDHIPCGPLPVYGDDVKLVVRDDDENSSGCTQPRTANKAYRPSPRIGDRRIRKLLASKYWKVTPKLKNGEHFNNDTETKAVYHRKKSHKQQRSQRDYPFKKRKLYFCSSVSNSDGEISSDGIASSPGKGSNGDTSCLGAIMHEATGTLAYAAGQHRSFQCRDSHVKLKIKSFRVPELFIDIPETATVGSLKRAVMEAVTAILGGELCVGVLHQGKKIRDDNKTLLQTGITHGNKTDALGFTLEPNTSQAPQSLGQEDNPSLFPCDTPQPITRYPAPSVAHNTIQLGTSDASPDCLVTNLGNLVDSDHDSAPSPPDMSIDKGTADSRALVPTVNAEALSVVPMRKSKRSEAAQRRIRRPFSVYEVEALVQAVEKLGTGRWRDVKLRAFDNAKHRTYVDLKVGKDKWKTLVHTSRISPQQRRGEPVPQELLDRVLAAHAYWSPQQAKQQLKQQSETCLLL
ncbi:unnamed protein product [Ilex paraguariensis]